MNTLIITPGQTNISRYLVRENNTAYRVRPRLAEMFLHAAEQARNLSNPWQIRSIFESNIPRPVREKIKRMLFWNDQPGYMILLDLPEECCDKNVFAAGLTSICSLPVSFRGEGGMVIRIKPRRQTAANPSFANAKEFFLHSDLSYSPIPPDTLIMVVKNIARNGGGESLFSCVAEIRHLLPSEIYHQLRLPQYYFSAPDHYIKSANEPLTPLPIITHTEAGLRVRFRLDKIRTESPEAYEAARVFNSMAEIKKEQVLLPKNSVVLLNQRYVLHGRTEFVPSFTEDDRELLRCYGTISPGKYENLNDATGELSY